MFTRHSGWTRAALLFAWLILLGVPALGQSFYGSLVSVVKDDQNNVIPGATIILVNTSTNERREGVSADDGAYRFLNLVPGTYRLEVELTGFQRYVRDQIEVNVQSAPRIEVSLKVGSIAETVQVAGTAPVLQTENASVGLVVGSRPVQELPLNGRNVHESDHARAFGRSAREQRGESDRQERVRGRQLPGRRRNGEPERLVLRRRAGAGFGLRQHRRADTRAPTRSPSSRCRPTTAAPSSAGSPAASSTWPPGRAPTPSAEASSNTTATRRSTPTRSSASEPGSIARRSSRTISAVRWAARC